MSDAARCPVVHFEIIGRNPDGLRSFYGDLFGWSFETDSPVAPEVSDAGAYGFHQPPGASGESGIPGGIGGGPDRAPHAMFYVGVPNVSQALASAERHGGKRVMGPARNPNGKLVVAHFTDPEGNLIGLAGPE